MEQTNIELNEEQRAAAESVAPVTLVIAGAGSGKTRTLIGRVEWLLRDCAVPPEQIIVLTYTVSAAAEIRVRLGAVQLGYCSTLHGFALRLLERYGPGFGLASKLAVLDEEQKERLLADVIAAMSWKGSVSKVREALRECGPGTFLDAVRSDLTPIELVCCVYYGRLLSDGFMDFDSILHFCAWMLSKMPDAELPWTHLLVDEVQDAAAVDMEIYDALNIPNKWFTGDVDQAVFAFRGGDMRSIMKLAARRGTANCYLNNNYRCASRICDAANALIAHNRNRIKKQMRSMTGEPGEVIVKTDCHTANEELTAIALSLQQQPSLSECAVLVRTNALVAEYADGLAACGIPVRQRVPRTLPQDWPAVRMFLSLLCNPENDYLAGLWLERNKGKREAERIKLEAMQCYTTINQHLLKLPIRIEPLDLIAKLPTTPFHPESIALIKAAMALLPAGGTLPELVALLDAEAHGADEVGEGVGVLTMHAAKGREWDCVFCPAFEDEIIPGHHKNEDVEESRRLAFMSFTRARHRLVISAAQTRRGPKWDPQPKPATPSRFIREAGL